MRFDAPSRPEPFDFRQPWSALLPVLELADSWPILDGDDARASTGHTDELSISQMFGGTEETCDGRPATRSAPPWQTEITLTAPQVTPGPTGWLATPWGEPVSGSELGRGRVTLGRDPRSDVVLTGRACSRRHAELRLQAGKVWLIDAGASNGVMLNGDRVRSAPLANGDWITLGAMRFQWRQIRGRRPQDRTVEIQSSR